MSNEKFDNKKSDSKGISETDKGYYEELYNDLPKEVVDILMQTHPLMGKNGEDAEATAYRTRRPAREDVEEIKEARMQQVSSEINEIRKAPQQEGEPTRYVSRRSRNSVSEDTHNPAEMGHKMKEDDYDDGIQYVSVMPARKKSKIVEEVSMQTLAPAKRKKSKKDPYEDTAAPARKKSKRERENMPFEDMSLDGRDNRPRYETLDFEERAKQEHLDSLYDDDYEDDYGKGRGKLGIILGVAGLILIIFLIFRTVSLGSQLEEAKNKLTQSEDYKSKYEQVQLEKMQVEEELNSLKDPSADSTSKTEGGTTDKKESTDKKENTAASTTTSGSYTEYTVQSGDTAWKIAAKTLGNGADYQKILDANGLKEGDSLQIGSKIKIPKA